MDHSGPGSLAEVEADRALSEDVDRCHEQWPSLESHSHHELTPDAAGPDRRPRTPAAMVETLTAHPRLLLYRHSSVVKLLLILKVYSMSSTGNLYSTSY